MTLLHSPIRAVIRSPLYSPLVGKSEDATPPPGFLFLTETISGITYYLTDSDGYFLVEPV